MKDPGDELAAAITMAADANKQAAASIAAMLNQVESKAAIMLANEAMAKMHYAARNTLLQHFRWHLVIGGAIGVGLFMLGATLDHLSVHPADITGMSCADESGGRVCYIWVVPPKQRQPDNTGKNKQ